MKINISCKEKEDLKLKVGDIISTEHESNNSYMVIYKNSNFQLISFEGFAFGSRHDTIEGLENFINQHPFLKFIHYSRDEYELNLIRKED